MEIDDLARLDNKELDPLHAIAHDRAPAGNTLATPHAFICSDGNTYWLKRDSQNGLAAELIAARLGSRIGASPNGRIVTLQDGIAPAGVDVSHLIGLTVGLRDVENSENVKDLSSYLKNGKFNPDIVDAASRARVTAFQTWIGVQSDTQILVQFTTGRVYSIDHGSAFGNISSLEKPQVIHRKIDGVPDGVGKDQSLLNLAVNSIENLKYKEILDSVARIPDGTEWNAERSRRFRIYEWLVYRRDHLREVLEEWLN